MTVRHFGKTDMDAFRFTDTFVKSADYAALEAEVSVQKDIVVRMRKLNSKVIAERDEGWNRIAALEARCRELDGLLSRVNNYRGADFKRISELEAFLNLCYEEKMIPTSDDLDALKVPVSFSDSALETACEHEWGEYAIDNAKGPAGPSERYVWYKCVKCGEPQVNTVNRTVKP